MPPDKCPFCAPKFFFSQIAFSTSVIYCIAAGKLSFQSSQNVFYAVKIMENNVFLIL